MVPKRLGERFDTLQMIPLQQLSTVCFDDLAHPLIMLLISLDSEDLIYTKSALAETYVFSVDTVVPVVCGNKITYSKI